MKKSLLEFIICPNCNSSFELADSVQKGGEITSASLVCQEGHSFPVTFGVPRLLRVDELTNTQKQVRNSFTSKWDRAVKYAYTRQTTQFELDWYLEKYGWRNLENLHDFLQTRQLVLDVGAGLGRHVKLYAEHTKGEVFGVDISQGIDIAYQHVGHVPNAHLIQADLTSLPFAKDFFDFIASEGVLHHTPDTETSFKYLVPFLKADGEIAIYIYKKKGPAREFCDDYIRSFTTRLSAEECYRVAEAITEFGKSLSDMKAEIKVPEDIPLLEIKAGKYDLQRFIYWHMFKCFWNDTLDFEANIMTNFDWYHPQYAHRHTPTQVEQWVQDMRLEILNFNVGDSGISVRAKKCAA